MGRTRRTTGEGGRSTVTESNGRPGDLPFPDAVEAFIRACPGPAPAVKALRLVAYQPIRGIPGLEPDDFAHSGPSKNHDGGKSSPIRTLKDVADAVFCTTDHLSKVARRYGYSILLAIRWVTFLQGYALHEQGARTGATKMKPQDVAVLTQRCGIPADATATMAREWPAGTAEGAKTIDEVDVAA